MFEARYLSFDKHQELKCITWGISGVLIYMAPGASEWLCVLDPCSGRYVCVCSDHARDGMASCCACVLQEKALKPREPVADSPSINLVASVDEGGV